jgi:hypothetical protein
LRKNRNHLANHLESATARFKKMSGVLLLTELFVSILVLVAVSRLGVIAYTGGLLEVLGFWLGIVFLVLAAKALFRRPASFKP